jgi:tetratricopeptide (TPR) repeat protein
MSILKAFGSIICLCLVCALCLTTHGGNNFTTQRGVAHDGVMYEIQPHVTGNTAVTDVNFQLSRVRELRTVEAPVGDGTTVPIQLPLTSIYKLRTTVNVPLVKAALGDKVRQGWIPVAGVDRAERMARQHGKPILFLEKSATAGASDRKLARLYATHKGFDRFVRVEKKVDDEIESEKLAAGLAKASEAFGEKSGAPRIACVDTRGRLIGVIPYGTAKEELDTKVTQFAELFATLRMLDRNIATGNALARRGRFNTALGIFKEVAGCDPDEKYYSSLVDTKRKQIDEAAEARLAKAQELLDRGNRVKALKYVNPVIADGGEFEFIEKARQIKAVCLGKAKPQDSRD